MKVAHICTSRLTYKVLQDKIVLLSKEGYQIDMISSQEGPDTSMFRENNIGQIYVDMERQINPIKDMKSIIDMTKVFKQEKYDIIHTHTAKAGIIGRIAGKLAKVPVVVHTAHGLPFFEGQSKLKYNIFKYMEIVGLMFSDYFASQNEEDLNLMKKYAKPEKLIYEGNGIDINKLTQIYNSITGEDIKSINDELNIPKQNITMLVGARFESVKNHELLIESLKLLKDKGITKFTCLLAGKGELEEDIKAKVQEYKLSDNVVFLGHRADIYRFIKSVDIVVLTSVKEGLPRILMESMYFKKPIVATDVLGTREVVDKNNTGLLSELGDREALAKNLELLMKDEKLREQFGRNGKVRIETKFTEQLVVKRIDTLYKSSMELKIKNSKVQENN